MTSPHFWLLVSKIEKEPRDIQSEKSSKDMANLRNLVSTIGANRGTEPGVRKEKMIIYKFIYVCK